MRKIIIDNQGIIKGFDNPFKNMDNLTIVEILDYKQMYNPVYDFKTQKLVETASEEEIDYIKLKTISIHKINEHISNNEISLALLELDNLKQYDIYVLNTRDFLTEI